MKQSKQVDDFIKQLLDMNFAGLDKDSKVTRDIFAYNTYKFLVHYLEGHKDKEFLNSQIQSTTQHSTIKPQIYTGSAFAIGQASLTAFTTTDWSKSRPAQAEDAK